MASSEASETKSIITSLLTSTPLRCTITQLCNDFRNTVGYILPFRKLGFADAEAYLRSVPDTVRILGSGPFAEVKGIVTERSAHINEMVARQKKNAIPANKRKYLKSFNKQCNLPKNRKDLKVCTSNLVENVSASLYEDEYISKVPKRVQNNLRKLIMQYPEGIWCRKLRDAYCKMFKEDINYEKYNFRSLIELCTDLTDIFHYIQPTSDDFILYDKTSAVPQLNQNEVVTGGKEMSKFDVDWSVSSTLIPDDIVQFLEQIPQLCLNDIQIGDHLDIIIGEIYDIHKFYVCPKYSDLDNFLTELEIFFCHHRNRYSVPELFFVEGLYCVSYYNNRYHRCVIVDTLLTSPDSIKVLFIDCGSVGEVSVTEVWYLPKQFGTMPCQIIEAKLSNIKSNDDCEQTVKKFKQLIKRRDILAEIMNVDNKEQILEVYLADVTNAEDVFYINDALVEKGYAEYL